MPFKTKKRKLRAKERRITISAHGLATYAVDTSNKDHAKSSTLQTAAQVDTGQSHLYVKGEIAKTALFALAIIGLQLLIRFSHIAF